MVNDEMALRFRAIRENLRLKQAEMAKAMGVSRGLVSLLEKGTAKFTDRNIKIVSKAYNVNEDWLKTGEGNMFNLPSDEPVAKDEDEKEFLYLFRHLTVPKKRLVLEILQEFTKIDAIEEKISSKNSANSTENTDIVQSVTLFQENSNGF